MLVRFILSGGKVIILKIFANILAFIAQMINSKPLYLRIADFRIRITFLPSKELINNSNLREELKVQLKDFITPSFTRADYEILVRYDKSIMINREAQQLLVPIYRKLSSKRMVIGYFNSLDHFNTALLEALNCLLLKSSGFILHASSIVIGAKLLVFCGNSGKGKSTIVKLLKSGTPVSDDQIIVRRRRGCYRYYASPLIERKKYPSLDLTGKSGKLYLLKQSKHYLLKRITPEKAINLLLPCISKPMLLPKEVYFPILLSSLTAFVSHQEIKYLFFGLHRNRLEQLLLS